MRSRFLSLIPFVLCNLMAPDMGGGSGGSSSSSASAASHPAEPTGDTPEAKYTSALKIIGEYFKQAVAATKEKDEAVGQVAGLNKQISDLTKERHDFKSQLDKKGEELSTMTGDRDTQKTGREKAESRITLIESFCKHSNVDLAGLDKFQAAKTVPEAQENKDGKALYDEWTALKNSGQGKKATAFFRKHKAELNEYAESTR